VEVVPVTSRSVEYAVSAVGSVEAFEIVQVTARVPGAVEKVHFREGARVRTGDVLVEIEPERYRLEVAEARAALEKAKAALAEAGAGLSRREGANEKNAGLIPGEEIDAWRTRSVTARAEMEAQEAALKLAERNAGDAVARAPFTGTIQTRDVQTGTYVQPGTLLSTLVRREPLLLRFQVPEGDAARLAPRMKARFRVRNVAGEHEARIVHVAESADLASRMVAVTAEILAPDDELRPGTFAEVTVPIGSPKSAAVIPETAVRPSERGFLAYVVEGGVARERILTLGLRTPDGLVEVRNGLAPAESLVVRGAEALHDGAKVAPATAGAHPASAGPGPSPEPAGASSPTGTRTRS
jgi:multidrug efflux system membrane fusion protein